MSRITLLEGYKPSNDEEYMNPKQLEYFRQKLLEWKRSFGRIARNLKPSQGRKLE